MDTIWGMIMFQWNKSTKVKWTGFKKNEGYNCKPNLCYICILTVDWLIWFCTQCYLFIWQQEIEKIKPDKQLIR